MEPEPPGALPFLFSLAFFPLISIGGIISGILFLAILLVCSAIVSASEVAFFSLSPQDIQDITDEKSKVSKALIQLKEKPKKLLATILISNNFINIAIVIVSDYLVRSMLPEATLTIWATSIAELLPLGIPFLATAIHFFITIVGVTFLLVLFGEVAPKIYANLNNVSFAKQMTVPMNYLMRFLTPISHLLVKWASKMEGSNPDKMTNDINIDELDKAISLTVDEGADPQDADILRSIIKFGNVTTKQIMKSRVDVTTLDIEETDYKTLMQIVKESGFSRIPVIREDFDKVEGILYVKDLLGHTAEDDNYNWQKLIRRDVLYVPESKKIDDLLKEFQSKRMHMAIVVDEFGGSAGLVTLEDVMEEVIGDIKDEFDEESEIDYEKINDYTYIFEGKSLLNDVCRIIGEDLEDFEEIRGQSDTLAGLVLEVLGSLPKKGREITHEKYTFRIHAATAKRIEKIKLTLAQYV